MTFVVFALSTSPHGAYNGLREVLSHHKKGGFSLPTFYNQATLSYNNTVTGSNIVQGELVEAISAAKTAVVDSYTNGSTVTYIISIVNSGAAPLTGLTLTDDLGAYAFGTDTLVPLTYVDTSVKYYADGVLQPSPAVTVTDGNLVISGINVPANGDTVVAYSVTANTFAPIEEAAQITNTVTISGDGLAQSVTADETISSSDEPILTISKALSPTSVTENGQLTYTFTIYNSGSAPAIATDNVTVTDNFDPILNPITVTYEGVTWTENVNYTYNPATGAFATVPGQITVPAATFTQDPETGAWSVAPGTVTLTVTGTV